MKFTAAIIAAAGALYASTGAAQSSNTSICDKYSMALFVSVFRGARARAFLPSLSR